MPDSVGVTDWFPPQGPPLLGMHYFRIEFPFIMNFFVRFWNEVFCLFVFFLFD